MKPLISRCRLHNGSVIEEGAIVELNEKDIIKSSDIVFIIEAKECNKDIKERRNIESLISLLQKELTDSGILDNRFAVVVFGGNGVFDEPRSIVHNNHFFVSDNKILSYLDNIPAGDVFIFNILCHNIIFCYIKQAMEVPIYSTLLTLRLS